MRSLALYLVIAVGLAMAPRSAPAGTFGLLPAFTSNPSDAVRASVWLTRAALDAFDAISDIARGYWESVRRTNPPPRPPLIHPIPVAPSPGPAIRPARGATPHRSAPVSRRAPEPQGATAARGAEG